MGFLDDIFGGGDTPAPRNYYQESADTIRAKVDLAPQVYSARSQYDPLYASLASRVKAQSLRDDLSLYDALEPQMSSLTARANAAARTSDLNDVISLSPLTRQAMREYNPDQAALLDELNSQALTELKAGATLDPSMRREALQTIMANQSSRGVGHSVRDLMEQVLTTGSAGQTLRDNRRKFAQSVMQNNTAVMGDPLSTILNRRSNAVPTVMSMTGAGSGGAPSFDSGIDANDVYDTNYNAAYSANVARANRNAGLLGGLLSLGGSLGGASIMAGK